MTSIEFTVERDDKEIELTITGYLHYAPASCKGHPDDWTPDESECEIEEILLNDVPWDGQLTNKEEKMALAELWNYAENY